MRNLLWVRFPIEAPLNWAYAFWIICGEMASWRTERPKCADFSRSTQGCLAPMRSTFYYASMTLWPRILRFVEEFNRACAARGLGASLRQTLSGLAAIQSVSRPYDVLSLPTTFSVALCCR
jgi:hypothetical protein